jgi:ABC-type transporter Mla maintaining outer membrane lipid asymmetry permease subunit MlaE
LVVKISHLSRGTNSLNFTLLIGRTVFITMPGIFGSKGGAAETKDLAYCMFRNTLITLAMVGISLGSVMKNKQYKPLFYFTAIAFSGDMVNGYCVACRKEVKHFMEGREVQIHKIKDDSVEKPTI